MAEGLSPGAGIGWEVVAHPHRGSDTSLFLSGTCLRTDGGTVIKFGSFLGSASQAMVSWDLDR